MAAAKSTAQRRRITPRRSAKTSRFRGVTLFADQQKYQAFIVVKGRRVHLGMWRDERDAAIARDRYALFLHLDPSTLQVPHASKRLGPADANALLRLARLRQKEGTYSSRYLGVHWNKQRERWDVTILVATRTHQSLAKFDDEYDAAIAYDQFVLHRDGPSAIRNFPELDLAPLSADEVRRMARAKAKARRTSRFRGVSWSARDKRWIAQVNVGNKPAYREYFEDELEAARAYDRKALEHHGGDAWLNFDPATGNEQEGAMRLTTRGSTPRPGRERSSNNTAPLRDRVVSALGATRKPMTRQQLANALALGPSDDRRLGTALVRLRAERSVVVERNGHDVTYRLDKVKRSTADVG
jgi:hypothetical protein